MFASTLSVPWAIRGLTSSVCREVTRESRPKGATYQGIPAAGSSPPAAGIISAWRSRSEAAIKPLNSSFALCTRAQSASHRSLLRRTRRGAPPGKGERAAAGTERPGAQLDLRRLARREGDGPVKRNPFPLQAVVAWRRVELKDRFPHEAVVCLVAKSAQTVGVGGWEEPARRLPFAGANLEDVGEVGAEHKAQRQRQRR